MHLVKCSLSLGREVERETSEEEPYINGEFPEISDDWERELERHFAEVHVDPEETVEEQKQRITWNHKREEHFQTRESSRDLGEPRPPTESS